MAAAGRGGARGGGGGDRPDEEMIDVGLAAHPPARALDEHPEPISLLTPPSCQAKSNRTSRRLTGARTLAGAASLPGGPWPMAPAARPLCFLTIVGISG